MESTWEFSDPSREMPPPLPIMKPIVNLSLSDLGALEICGPVGVAL